ncbi:MAG: hypothetical protein [Cressdnaviricota sp.]|nr:MAG: hypothetical protein [Cressdnaviricota sp.]
MNNLVKASEQEGSHAVSSDEVPQDEWEDHGEVQVLRRSHATVSAGKRPRYHMPPHNQEDEDILEQPDLAEYFAQWEISEKDQILMCRAYASYLAVKKNKFEPK